MLGLAHVGVLGALGALLGARFDGCCRGLGFPLRLGLEKRLRLGLGHRQGLGLELGRQRRFSLGLGLCVGLRR
ncbi:hypothetical protein C5B96_03135 [Subtercola sp. Z020]|nr:hypothetical protein C5B96_03135 [Subtercola sp. Z020]